MDNSVVCVKCKRTVPYSCAIYEWDHINSTPGNDIAIGWVCSDCRPSCVVPSIVTVHDLIKAEALIRNFYQFKDALDKDNEPTPAEQQDISFADSQWLLYKIATLMAEKRRLYGRVEILGKFAESATYGEVITEIRSILKDFK